MTPPGFVPPVTYFVVSVIALVVAALALLALVALEAKLLEASPAPASLVSEAY